MCSLKASRLETLEERYFSLSPKGRKKTNAQRQAVKQAFPLSQLFCSIRVSDWIHLIHIGEGNLL